MRATDLGFRSPKEKTAEYINPVVTFDGRCLPLVHPNNTTTFSKSKRFTQYEVDARRTGDKAGPGAYNLIQTPGSEWRIKGTPLYKNLHGSKDTGDNGYYFTGHSMVYEPSFVLQRRRIMREASVPSTNRDTGRRSLSIGENDTSIRTSEDQIRLGSGGRERKCTTGGMERERKVMTTAFNKKKFYRKASEQLRNSPYEITGAKKIIIKKRMNVGNDEKILKTELVMG